MFVAQPIDTSIASSDTSEYANAAGTSLGTMVDGIMHLLRDLKTNARNDNKNWMAKEYKYMRESFENRLTDMLDHLQAKIALTLNNSIKRRPGTLSDLASISEC